jgi:capsular exopolysaccharide synthesis family protein
MSQFSDAIRKARLAMTYTGPINAGSSEHQVVAITSAFSGEGKTTLSLCIGRSMAAAGKRVLLVDCDLRVRGLSSRLDIEPKGGLQEVIGGELSWREAVTRDPASGLDVLSAATSQSKFAHEPFVDDKFVNLLRELRGEYDLVLLDCPPVLVLSDASHIVAAADACMVVALQGSTPASATREVMEALAITGTPLMGFVLNGVDNVGMPYGYARRSKYFVSKYFTDARTGAA